MLHLSDSGYNRTNPIVRQRSDKTFTDNQIEILKCEKKQLAGPQSGSFTARLRGLGPEKMVRHVQRTSARGKASNLKVYCLNIL